MDKIKKNKVIAGDFVDCPIIITFGIFGVVVPKKDLQELGLKALSIDETTIAAYELLTPARLEEAVNGIARGLVTTTLLGPIGLLGFKRKKGVNQIIINWAFEKQSLITLTDKDFAKFRAKFKDLEVNATKVVENNSSTADELLKFKQLLDAGAISQDEFDKKKRELL